MNSPLARLLPIAMDAEAIKQNGWCEDRILVVHAEDTRLTRMERQVIENIGNKLYGRKTNGR